MCVWCVRQTVETSSVCGVCKTDYGNKQCVCVVCVKQTVETSSVCGVCKTDCGNKQCVWCV